MRSSKLLSKLRAGRPCRVCALGNYLPFFVRHAAANDYDAIWIDLEHSTMSSREVQALLALCHSWDIDGLVRPGTGERSDIYRHFENGAAGLMMPMVNDAADARAIVRATKYPPLGNRGFAGSGLDSDYTLALRPEGQRYTDDANAETFIMAQIETAEAVANVEAILAVEGIDAVFVGPADLGLRLRTTPTGLELEDAIAQVAAAARRSGKAWGITSTSIDDVAKRWRQGAQLVPHGSDFGLMQQLQTWGNELDALDRTR
jgi:2-keto-3-deoxy-L-rhamnonate aldolase RhmA